MTKRWVRAALGVARCLLIGAAVSELAIPFLGYFWHLAHRDKYEQSSLRLQIPAPYMAFSSPKMISIVRFNPTVPFFGRVTPISNHFLKESSIAIFPPPNNQPAFDYKQHYDRVSHFLLGESQLQGLSPEGTRNFGTQLGQMYCLQFGNRYMTRISCFLQGSNLSLMYLGEPKYSEDLYWVARNISYGETGTR